MKVVKRLTTVLLAICVFVAGAKVWKYILLDDSRSYTRIMMHELYGSETNIDILFVGSSHVYRSFIPEVTDKEFDKYTFNAGSSSQYMDGSLALIKETAKNNKLSHIYLEMYYGIAEGEDYNERESLTSTYIISDYMRPSINKVEYLINASNKDHWINSLLIARRYWKNFFDSTYVKNVIASKRTDAYRNYEYVRYEKDFEYYMNRGFVASDAQVNPAMHFNKSAYGPIEVGTTISRVSDWYNSIVDIIDYCRAENIELTFFISPEPEWTLVGKSNYDEYHDFISDIADEHGIEFVDFNLCKDEFFDTNDITMFMDEDHLNTKGAEKFSVLFSRYFCGKLDGDDIFYDSFSEKISSESKPVYGIAGPVVDEEGNRKCRIITGSSEYIYKVVEMKDDGSQLVLKNLDDSKDFVIPADDTGILIITYKNIHTGKEEEMEAVF